MSIHKRLQAMKALWDIFLDQDADPDSLDRHKIFLKSEYKNRSLLWPLLYPLKRCPLKRR